MESFVFAEIAEKKGWRKRALSNSLFNYYNEYPGEKEKEEKKHTRRRDRGSRQRNL
jgi:hypothetical protein